MRPLFQIMAAYFLISPLLPEATAAEPPRRWLYLQTNRQVSENVTAGIDGAMYTTWQHNFGESEAFASYALKAKRPPANEYGPSLRLHRRRQLSETANSLLGG